MSTPLDAPTDPIERMRRNLDGPLAAGAAELERSRGLPHAYYVAAGVNGTVVLEAAGAYPLDDVLAWAGDMVPAPHWWTLRTGTTGIPRTELYASGSIGGLLVTIRCEVPERGEPIPVEPTTDDVLTAAARARWPR